MHGERANRLAQELQQEIAMIALQELKDPRLGFVTITRSTLSKDLSQLKVFFSCLGTEAERQQSQQALDDAAGFIRGLIKKRFRLKVIPMVEFRYDESIAGSIELADTFDRIRHTPAPPSTE